MDQDDSTMISSPSSPGDHDESTMTTFHEEDDDEQTFNNNTTTTGNSTTGVRPPTTTQPRAMTPQNDHLNAAAAGELSPPRSQTHVTVSRGKNMSAGDFYDRDNDNDEDDEDDEGLGDEILNANLARGGPGGKVGGDKGGEWRAGTWKDKKAQEDMQRVWENNFVDRDFSLSQFGDVLAHKIPGLVQQGQVVQQQQ